MCLVCSEVTFVVFYWPRLFMRSEKSENRCLKDVPMMIRIKNLPLAVKAGVNRRTDTGQYQIGFGKALDLAGSTV